MATEVKVIKVRRGPYTDFDKTKMNAGEPAITTSGDPNALDGKGVYMGVGPGQVKQVAMIEDIEDILNNAVDGAVDEATQQAEAEADRAEAAATQLASTVTQVTTNTANIAQLNERLSHIDTAVEEELTPIVSEVNQIQATLPRKVNQPLNGNLQPVNGTNGQVLRTKGDGSTEWATVGLPTDAQTAEAVEAWLDEHPEATTTVEDGSITVPKLSSDVANKLVNIVNVKDYGAINNDGVIDTAALQACIDANPHAAIFFPKGTYTIDAPIKCYSQTGGTFLFLGGVTIQARAEMPYMFYFHNYSDSGVTRGGVGPFGIFGGVLDANGMAEECIRSENAWVLRLTDVLCINFTVCGIRATGGGLHHYTRVKCDIEQRFPWSEGTTTGIIADQIDSFFTDIQIMSVKYAVKIGGGGHIFSGCYFMSRINYHLDDTLHWQGIGVYIENKDVAPLVTFNNCYFDSHIYTFWSDSSKVWDLDVNNCRFYYTHETQFDAEQAYILGGNNINIRARGCAIFSRPNCDTLLGRMSYSARNNKNFIFEQNKPLDTYIGNVLNVANMGGGLLEFGNDVKKDDLFWVGAISNANLKGGTYKMTIAYGDNYTELIFKNNDATNKFTLVDAKYGFKLAFFSVFIGQAPKSATGTIETVTYYPIYLYANVAFRGQVIITLEPLSFKPASCYIFNDGWRAPSGPVDDPFIMQLIKVEPVIPQKTVYFIGDSITAGTGCDVPYHQVLQEMANADGYNLSCLNYGVGGIGYYTSPAIGTTVDVGNGVEGVGSPTEITARTRMIDIVRSLPSSIPYAVVFAGTNDYGASVPLEDTDRASGEVTCFSYMFSLTMNELSAKTNNILVVSPIRREGGTNPNAKNRTLQEYGNAVKENALRYGALVYDGYDMPFNPDNTVNKTAYVPDGLHPNDAGHRKIAMALYEKLKELLA